MSKEAMKLAIKLLKSSHVSTDLVWERHDCVQALEESLAKQECVYTNDTSEERVYETHKNVHEQEQGKPVAWGMEGKDGFIFDVICPAEHEREEGGYTTPLYTTPQQRKPLTDDECLKIVWETNTVCEAIRKAEAAHGIKENT